MDLILNADDFGRSHEINRAVIRAHCQGVLNSASLMVAGEAAEEAVDLARAHPSLAVGLHVVAVDGPAVLPPERLPHLVDSSGRFPDAPVSLGLRYAFSAIARRELTEELAAQFQRFTATGLPLSHVDGHQHMHMHPAVFDLLLPLARLYGAKRIRVVRDELSVAVRHSLRRLPAKVMAGLFFAALARRCRGHMELTWPIPHRTYGLFQSGDMNERYLLSVLRHADGPSEIYFHPTDGPRLDALGPNPTDFQTLLSPMVRRQVEAHRLRTAGRRTILPPARGQVPHGAGPAVS